MALLIHIDAVARSPVEIHDRFETLALEWRPINLEGTTPARVSVDGSGLSLSAAAGSSAGLAHTTSITGNFEVEAEIGADDAIGLAVIAVGSDGAPDVRNYTMLTVTTRDGVVVVEQRDRQAGVADVHDPRGVIAAERYRAVLDGQTFSVPFTSTNGRIRILHEALSGTFHFYYGTRLERWGITSDDWLEVAPHYAWLPPGQAYRIALLCHNDTGETERTARFRGLRLASTAVDDQDDRETGFRVARRGFTWSGFAGEATVVTFGPEFTHDRNIKLVFWDRANNAPAWRLTNQFLLNFEFFEGGDAIHAGCHEAMSDRQRHGQSIVVEEDNAVRKVVRWKGVPLNPNYHYVAEGTGGPDRPAFEEIWTLYPDGSGTRQLIDTPKLDGDRHATWGPEFIELMPIGGSTVEAGDLCASPALTLLDLGTRATEFHPPDPRGAFDESTWAWEQIIFAAHFKDGTPDFYLAYSQDEEVPETWCGLPLQGQLSWHKTTQRFSHWPVGREPYGQNTNGRGATSRSYASHLNEVTHTSLVSAGYYERGIEWADNFRTDPETGRRYRRHIMAVGVTDPRDFQAMREAVGTWLRPGTITPVDATCRFVRVDREKRALVLESLRPGQPCRFRLTPGSHAVRHPALEIGGWPDREVSAVYVDGAPVPFRSARVGDAMLVWLQARLDEPAVIEVR
jgi:hypothetical protein